MKKLILIYSMVFLNQLNLYSQTGLYFPSTGQGYAYVPHNPIYNVGTGDFTIEAWILVDPLGLQGDYTIFSNDEIGGNGVQIIYVSDPTYPHLKFRRGINISIVNAPNLADGICHHIAFVKSSVQAQFYLDGLPLSPYFGGPITFTVNNTNDIYIGAQNYGGFPDHFFYGSIRDVRYWSMARSQSQIQQNMYALGNTAGLLGNFAPGIENPVWPATYSTDCQPCASLPSAVTITANGPTAICQGGSVTLSSNAPAGVSFSWQKVFTTGILSTSPTLTVNSSGSYQLFVTNSCGTVISNSINVTVALQVPTASITAAGPTNFCQGNSVALNANLGSNFSYQWKKDGINISGATTPTYYANTTGNYSVVVTNACGSSTSNVIPVNVSAGSLTFYITFLGHFPCPGQCNGAFFILDSMNTGVPPYTYNYSGPGNFNLINGGISVTNLCASQSPFPSGTITVTDATGCSSTQSTGSPEPVPTQNPSFTITPACNSNNGSITISGLISAYWNCNSMRIRDEFYNFITNATEWNPVNLPAGNYILETYCSAPSLATGPCSQYFPFTIPGGITPASITASGSTLLCNGSTVTLNANTGTGLSYQWQLNGNNIAGANSSSYIASTAGNYAVIVTDSCGSNPSNIITVTVGTAPNASVTASGSTSICAGNSVTLNANTGTALTYQWKLNGNNINGATSSSYAANTAGNYSVVVSNSCGSSTSNAISVTVGIAPTATITASGSTSICAGNSVTLNANTGTGLSYQWKLNGNNITGATSSSYSANTAGNYSVVVSNSCGGSTSNVISVTVSSAPSAAITASGSTSFCSGSSVTLVANTGIGLTYQWQLNGNNISGATNSTFDATTSGNYSVIVSNNCGNSISNVINVNVTFVPGSAGSIAGPDTVCKQSTHTFSVNSVAGATNYVWSVPPMAQIISGAGTNSIVVKFKTKQGNVTVKAANQCGAGQLSVIPVTVVKCFSANNAVMRTTVTEEISIYPNPTQNEFNCIITGEVDQLFSLIVFDYAGRIVELHENIISNQPFTFGNNLSPGIYFVEINSGEEREMFKIVKVE